MSVGGLACAQPIAALWVVCGHGLTCEICLWAWRKAQNTLDTTVVAKDVMLRLYAFQLRAQCQWCMEGGLVCAQPITALYLTTGSWLNTRNMTNIMVLSRCNILHVRFKVKNPVVPVKSLECAKPIAMLWQTDGRGLSYKIRVVLLYQLWAWPKAQKTTDTTVVTKGVMLSLYVFQLRAQGQQCVEEGLECAQQHFI